MLKYLHRELNGKIPFHVYNNKYINFVTKDNPIVTIPSRFYYFQDFSLFKAGASLINSKDIKYTLNNSPLPVPASECLVDATTQGLAEILKTLREIQRCQQVYVSVFNVSYHTNIPYTSPERHKETMSLLVSEVQMNRTTKVVAAMGCYLTQPAYNHIVQQLEGCKQLHTLILTEVPRKPTTGVMPMNVERTFANMKTLRFLSLQNSGISRHSSTSLMASLSNCVNLVQVNLSYNILVDSIAGLFNNCGFQYLEGVALASSELSKHDIKAISIAMSEGKLPRLNVLDLSLNSLTNCMEDFIQLEGEFQVCYSHLQLLRLCGTRLNEADVINLSKGLRQHRFPTLRTLDIGSHDLSGNIGQLLQGIGGSSIENLNLANTNLTMKDLKDLSGNLNVSCKHLCLFANKLTGIVGELFTKPKTFSLIILDLTATQLNYRDITNLSNVVKAQKFPQLRKLLLNGINLHCMEDAVQDLVKSCVEFFRHHEVNISISLDGLDDSEGFRSKVSSICCGTPVSITCTQVSRRDRNLMEVCYSRTMTILAHPGLNIIPGPDDAPGPPENIVFYLNVEKEENET